MRRLASLPPQRKRKTCQDSSPGGKKEGLAGGRIGAAKNREEKMHETKGKRVLGILLENMKGRGDCPEGGKPGAQNPQGREMALYSKVGIL